MASTRSRTSTAGGTPAAGTAGLRSWATTLELTDLLLQLGDLKLLAQHLDLIGEGAQLFILWGEAG